MTIKPIDMQTNIGQMHEVARHQQAQNESLVTQMHHLDREASDKSLNADSRLDESTESQNLANRLDEHDKGGGKQRGRKRRHPGAPDEKQPGKVEVVKDANLGRFIDIKK